jgi:cell division initiation protein
MEKFKTSLPGYNKDDVNRFVNNVITEYESLLNRLKISDSRVQELEKELQHYKEIERNLNKAILLAEEATQNIKKAAYDESKVVIEDAKKNASRVINTALIRAENIEKEAEALKRRVVSFKRRFRGLVEEHLEEIERFDETL